MSQRNIIEINGKKYDALSGQLLDGPKPQGAPASVGVSIDGFHRFRPGTTPIPHHSKPAAKTPAKQTVSRGVSPHPHKPEHAHTLLRHIVKKPTKPIHGLQTAQATGYVENQPPAQPLFVSEERLQRAHDVERNRLVHRFSATDIALPGAHRLTKRSENLAVRQPPPQHHSRPATKPAHDPSKTAVERLVDESLARATSHEHHEKPNRRIHHRIARRIGLSPRLVGTAAIIITGLLLGAFVLYQNVPSLAMHVAASRAGFDAGMPSYHPSGFAFSGPINYSHGRVTINFRATTDSRSFALTQRPSNWTSESLLTNFVSDKTEDYQTYRDKGLTLYIYDGSTATWVDKGIWYTITGKSQLSSDQIINIAASL